MGRVRSRHKDSFPWSDNLQVRIRRKWFSLQDYNVFYFRPVTFYHILKLFQPQSPDAQTPAIADGTPPPPPPPPVIDPKKILVSEFYDEIVFHEPTQLMQEMLTQVQPVTNGTWTHDTDCKCFYEFAIKWSLLTTLSLVEEKKVKSLEHILETRKKVKAEIALMKEKLQKTRELIAKESSANQNTQQ